MHRSHSSNYDKGKAQIVNLPQGGKLKFKSHQVRFKAILQYSRIKDRRDILISKNHDQSL
jgi:hypothetical protein